MDIIGEIVHNYLHIPLIIISVLIYGILLYYIFFKPVRKILDKRKEIITNGEEIAKKAKAEVEEKLSFVEEKLREARKEGLRKREEARKELLEYQSNLLLKVKEELEHKKIQREKEFQHFEKEAREKIEKEIPTFAVRITEKILKRRIAS